MYFVIDQVMEFHDIHDPDGYFAIEGLAAAAIVQSDLAAHREIGLFQ
jgi:hypothetical protein